MVIVSCKNFYSVQKIFHVFNRKSNQTSTIFVIHFNFFFFPSSHSPVHLSRTLAKDSMALYQHSTCCSFAIQWFLDENPEYWPFVPVRQEKINKIEDINVHNSMKTNSIHFQYADDVPLPPNNNNYQFTYEQKLAIERFFHEKKYLTSPNSNLDLYHAAIVAICK